MNILSVILMSIVGVGLIIYVLRAIVRVMLISAVKSLNERYPTSTWLKKCPVNFFGVKSKGLGQVRGNGILVLTEKMLVFRQLAPGQFIEIPIDNAREIEHPTSFLGKTKMRELLVVNFMNDEGEPDAVGFLVNDPRGWATEINALKAR